MLVHQRVHVNFIWMKGVCFYVLLALVITRKWVMFKDDLEHVMNVRRADVTQTYRKKKVWYLLVLKKMTCFCVKKVYLADDIFAFLLFRFTILMSCAMWEYHDLPIVHSNSSFWMCPKVFFSLKNMNQTIAKIVKKTAVWACLGRGFAGKNRKTWTNISYVPGPSGKKTSISLQN